MGARKILFFSLLGLLVSCADSTPPSLTGESTDELSETIKSEGVTGNNSEAYPKKLASLNLPNPVQIHPKVISGGLPEGDDAFEELKNLGVKTVISVDGMTPDVETASKYGLKYVHLPHGYDGVPEARAKELAKAVKELDGPIYIHCHHGKHRSPAAASVACVSAGLIPSSQAVSVLKFAGTNPNYRGLYQSAENAVALEESLLDQLDVEFHAKLPIPPVAEAMVAISHSHDHLKWIEEAGWKTPANHPDLDPAHEALIMREHFTEMLRSEAVEKQPEGFIEMIKESEEAAQKLELELRNWNKSARPATPPRSLKESASVISHNCKACHKQYRDIPLSEKGT